MKQYRGVILAVALMIPLLAFAGSAFAMDMGSVTILSPKNGAVLANGMGDKLEYDVHLSPNGNHLYVYVDDASPIIVRNVSHCPCSMELPPLSPGRHTIAVKEATASHDLTGVQGVVTVTVK